MKLLEELLPGCWLVGPKIFEDHRGRFVKTLQSSFFEEAGLPFEMREEFYSTSAKDVIRGMHFQLPPHDHIKLVTCVTGTIEDVLLDLRPCKSFGQVASVELSAENARAVYVPKGIAHGFVSRTEGSLVLYKTSTEHAPTHDMGILWNSFGHDWGTSSPVVSGRDTQHPALGEFKSPFQTP